MLKHHKIIFTTTLSTLLLSARIKAVLAVPLIPSTHPLRKKKAYSAKRASHILRIQNPFVHTNLLEHVITGDRAEPKSLLLREISSSTPHTQITASQSEQEEGQKALKC